MDAVQLIIDGARAVGQLPGVHWKLLTDQIRHLRAVPDNL
jgi:hypothetical protein